jgi:hypothetical protein
MAESYKSTGTSLNSGNNTIYQMSFGATAAIVNSINFSNVTGSGAGTVTLEVVKTVSGTLVPYSLITNAVIPISTTLQALDAPIVLNYNDYLRATPGLSGYIHAFVSALEIV